MKTVGVVLLLAPLVAAISPVAAGKEESVWTDLIGQVRDEKETMESDLKSEAHLYDKESCQYKNTRKNNLATVAQAAQTMSEEEEQMETQKAIQETQQQASQGFDRDTLQATNNLSDEHADFDKRLAEVNESLTALMGGGFGDNGKKSYNSDDCNSANAGSIAQLSAAEAKFGGDAGDSIGSSFLQQKGNPQFEGKADQVKQMVASLRFGQQNNCVALAQKRSDLIAAHDAEIDAQTEAKTNAENNNAHARATLDAANTAFQQARNSFESARDLKKNTENTIESNRKDFQDKTDVFNDSREKLTATIEGASSAVATLRKFVPGGNKANEFLQMRSNPAAKTARMIGGVAVEVSEGLQKTFNEADDSKAAAISAMEDATSKKNAATEAQSAAADAEEAADLDHKTSVDAFESAKKSQNDASEALVSAKQQQADDTKLDAANRANSAAALNQLQMAMKQFKIHAAAQIAKEAKMSGASDDDKARAGTKGGAGAIMGLLESFESRMKATVEAMTNTQATNSRANKESVDTATTTLDNARASLRNADDQMQEAASEHSQRLSELATADAEFELATTEFKNTDAASGTGMQNANQKTMDDAKSGIKNVFQAVTKFDDSTGGQDATNAFTGSKAGKAIYDKFEPDS